MSGGGKGGTDSNSEVTAARNEEAARQANIRQGTQKVSDLFDTQFTPDFYAGRAKSFTDYALPQEQDQFNNAKKQLIFALDRRGALDSSSRASLGADLAKRDAIQRQNIADQGQTYANTAKANVEGARADLINTLNATGDVTGAVNGATARSQILSAVPGYSPIASLFSDFTAGLGQQAAAERAFSYGAGPRPAVNTGLFSPRSGAVVNG
jgi:hypothetical protein